METKRNLDHLQYDENLYDLMRFLIPFNLTTQNKSLNKDLLSDNGLEKSQFLTCTSMTLLAKTS